MSTYRYDQPTPLEETMQAFADIVRAGKALDIGVSEWTANRSAKAAGARPDPSLMSRIDQALERVVIRNPGETARNAPQGHPCS